MRESPKENKMGIMPVPRLILNISLPMMFSMLIQALYNIVDSYFVGKISEEAFTAVSLAFPVQNLMLAFGLGTAIGVNALLATRLGQKRFDDVSKTAMNGLFLGFCNFVLFFLLAIFFTKPYFVSQAQGVSAIVDYGELYLKACIYGSLGLFELFMFDRILQGTGLTFYTMISQICGAVTNIVFDPLLIFGIGPFPALGITGAAIATVLGQWVSMFISLFFNITKNHEVRFSLKRLKPDWHTIKQIYAVGIPTILLNAISSVTTYFMNLILGAFSTTAIAVYGAYFKLNSFIFMPLFGLNNGLVPIIAYNYGAGHKERIQKTIRIGLLFGIVIMALGTLIFELFPAPLLKLFSAGEDMLSIGTVALRIIASSFMGAAIAITLSSVFQGFSSAVYSMIVSFLRQLVVLLPVAYIMAKTGSLNRVWLSFPVAEVASVLVSVLCYLRIKRTKIAPMAEETPKNPANS